jgi:hypothetical protein
MSSETKLSDLIFPRIPPIKIPPLPRTPVYADTFYDRLRHHIEETQDQLGDNQELAILYYTTGGDPIVISDIGYHNPNLIILYGMDSKGNESNVLLHMESVQLVLKIIKVDNKPKRKIGFLNE